MIRGKSVIGIIPARQGSKGLPGKNIKQICGKPLIAWSIESGTRSKYIDTIVVSTDSKKIADIAKRFDANVPFIRPKELATDETNTIDVVLHALNHYEVNLNQKFEYIVLLEPTSPIRQSNDIDLMLEKLDNLSEDFDAIVSLGKVHEHPSIMKTINLQKVESYIGNHTNPTRRQDFPPVFYPFGVAYICKVKVLLAQKTFYPERTTHYIIQRKQCIEIDDECDFLAAEAIMNNMV